jgi:RHS repeat-associated protein
MRRFSPSAILAAALLVLISVVLNRPATAQSPNVQGPAMAIGESPYAIYNNPADIDHVNPINGNIYIKIPLLSYPQVGKGLRLQFNIYYNEKQWYIPNFAPSPQQNGTFTGAWSWYDFNQNSVQMDTVGAYVARDQHLDFGQDDVDTSQTVGGQFTSCTYNTITLAFWVRSSDGSKHYYGDNSSQNDQGNACTTNPYGLTGNIYPASDESGYTPANGSYVSGSTQIYDSSGVKYTSSGVTGETVTDPNGNSIVSTANGWTDSVGNNLPGSTALPGYSDNGGGSAQDPVPGVPVAPGSTTCPTGTTAAREWYVPTEGSTHQYYYLCYSTFTFQTAFNVQNYIPSDQIAEASSSNQNSRPALLLTAVELPNRTAYTFTYDQYLSLTRLGLPTGGSISYTWQNTLLGQGNSIPMSRALKTRTVNDGNGNIAKWTYNWQLTGTPFWSIVTDPLGNDVEHEFENVTFLEDQQTEYTGCGPHDTFRPGGACSGTLMKTESYLYTQIVSTAADPNTPSWSQGPLYKPSTVTTTLPVPGGNLITKALTTFSPAYGTPCTTYTDFGAINISGLYTNHHTSPCSQYPQPQSVATYNYGSSGPGGLLRTDTTKYQWQVSNSALAANFLDIPSSIVRTDGSGNWASQTGYGYDGAGNQTSISRYLSNSSSLTSTTQYNSQGMPTLITDPRGHKTSISSYQCSGAFPQTVVTPYGSTTTVVETTTYGYDCTTGEMTSKTDPNNQITSYSYNDPLNRLKGVAYPDGGSLGINYSDSQSGSLPYVTTSQATGEAAGPINNQTDYDGLGRPIHQILTSDTSGADFVDTTYDLLGRVHSVSNPHRSTPVPTEDGTTYSTYDALGRKVIQTRPGGSTQQWCYGGMILNGQTDCTASNTANATGKSQYWIDFFDETARHSQNTTDPLGRLTTAMEPDNTHAPKWKTDYSYNALDDLIMLSQYGAPGNGVVARSFGYDALGRLTNACNPETVPLNGNHCASTGPWSQVYAYDANDNVSSRTDARGIVTTYGYDDLDRVTSKLYSDSTLSSYYYYDVIETGQGPDYPIGRLEFTATAPGKTRPDPNDPSIVGVRCYNYDKVGRVAATCTFFDTVANENGFGGNLSFLYNLAGNVKQEATYNPLQTLSAVFDSTHDAAGRLLSITLDPTSIGLSPSIPTTVFNAAPSSSGAPAYSAMGLEHAEISENIPGQPIMFYNHSFNNRSWPLSSGYVTGAAAVGGAGLAAYSYNLGYVANGMVGYAADSATGTIGTETADDLKRLTSAQYTAGPYSGLNLSWTYDAFGNRLTQTVSGTPSIPVPSSQWAHYDASNHITGSNILPAGLQYDNAGNVLYDGVNQYVYDAENRLCATKIGSLFELFVYDVDGNRIGKGTISPPQGAPFNSSLCNLMTPSNNFAMTEAYNLDLTGQLVEDYKANNQWHNTNIFADGRLIATYASNYMDVVMTDWLGTRRAKLPGNTSLSNMTEFLSLPFGDGYTIVGGNGVTDTSLFFTGKQHDADTGLENFVARYLSSSTGRFMSPDPSGLVYADQANPQTFNLYEYVVNNPLSHIDPWGLALQYNCTTTTQASSTTGSSGIGSDGSIVQNVTVNSGTSTCTVFDDGLGGPTSNIPTQHFQQFTKLPQINTACPPVPVHPAGADINKNMALAKNEGIFNPLAPLWFRNQVDYGKPWDYKTQGSQYEDFGNFNYGATGTAAYAPAFTLRRAAGRAQRGHPASPQFGGDPGSLPSIFLNPFGGTAPYGDDPNDQSQMNLGIQYARMGCGG